MIIRADARHIPLVDGCVQCVVTSPPYWGLRDYGHGDQIGLEPTPDAYVNSIVDVFRQLRRVLRDDGTVWLNLGDTYFNGDKWGGGGQNVGKHTLAQDGSVPSWIVRQRKPLCRCAADVCLLHPGMTTCSLRGLKPKDLCGIPWRVAFALQADGWYLRSDVIWAKPNPMPESIKDRPTKSHEYLFLLTKSERYHYDADAIREPYAESTLKEAATGYTGTARKEYAAAGAQDPSETKRRVQESIRRRVGMVQAYAGKNAAADEQDAARRMSLNGKAARDAGGEHGNPFGKGANKRSVWTVPTKPFAGAHFATMPEALIEPCILAGCPAGGLVFDPFLGSGTVGVVAERFGRRWVGTDLSYQPLSKKRTAQRGIRFDQPLSADAVREDVGQPIVPLRA